MSKFKQGNVELDSGKKIIFGDDTEQTSAALPLNNTTEFTPDADYEPATKKYVDDNAGGGSSDKIEEGNSSVEVVDTGTGYITFNIDGTETVRIAEEGLGIGTEPGNQYRLHTVGIDGSFNYINLENFSSTAANNTNAFICRRGRGTNASRLAVSAGDIIFNFQVWAQTGAGTSSTQVGAFRGKCDTTSPYTGGYDWYCWNGSSWKIPFETYSDEVVIGVPILRPGADDSYDIGTASYRWDDIYATNTTIQTSDERKKENITDSDLGLDFICALRPVSYKWKDYTSTEEVPDPDAEPGTLQTVEVEHTHIRTHYGMVAQEVETTLSGIGKSTTDFAGFIYNEEADMFGLRYQEFISPMIKAIQELKVENDTLKAQMVDVVARLEALEGA